MNINNQYKYFYKKRYNNIIAASILYIFNLKQPLTLIYAHNLDFDGRLIIENISFLKDVKINSRTHKNSIYNLEIFYYSKKIEFRCSFKLFPFSLNKISLLLGINSKLIFPHKFASLKKLNYIGPTPAPFYFRDKNAYIYFKKKNKNFFNFKKIILHYCLRDVYIVFKLVKKIFNVCNLLHLNILTEKIYSISAISLFLFKNYFNEKNINLKYIKEIDDIVRLGYYGGRCEVFGNSYHDEKIFHYDFTGMYSQCMEEKFAYGKFKICFKNLDLQQAGFYHISFYSEMEYPILPHHCAKNGKLMFTNGDLEGVYWFEEINYFLSQGGKIKKINYGVVFENYDYCFKNIVKTCNNLRQQGGFYNALGKLIVNSLYGRLGMNKSNSITVVAPEEEINWWFDNSKVISCSSINKLYIVRALINNKIKKKFPLCSDIFLISNVTIAAAVTSKARIKLHKAVMDVKKNDGRILYVDTDSVFAAFKKDVSNQQHGEIFWNTSKKDTLVKNCIFVAPKIYGVQYYHQKDVIKFKGVKSMMSYEKFKAIAFSSNNIILNYSWILKKNLNLIEKEGMKKLTLHYDKRKFTEFNKETKPFFFTNGDYTD